MKPLIYFIIFFYLTSNLSAQELRKITKAKDLFGEIYFVLKDNKNIKQGPYLRYHESFSLNNKAVDSYGKFYQNKKTGVWLYCDVNHPMNPLITLGPYADDQKLGQWIYFYSPIIKDTSVFNLLGFKKLTDVTLPSKGSEEFQIALDTSGMKAASIGNYSMNKKEGEWSYFSRSGALVYKIDFSNKVVITDNRPVSFDLLGGIQRFKELVHQSATEQTNEAFFYQNSSVILEISTFSDSITMQRIGSFWSEPFAKAMEKIFRSMSLEWISYDPRLEFNKLKVYIDYKVDGRTGLAKIDSVVPLFNTPILNYN